MELCILSSNQVDPNERFSPGNHGGYRTASWNLFLKKNSRYYSCPKCGKKTLIRKSTLNAWNPPESPFTDDLKVHFGEEHTHTAYFDFFCKGCGLAVRLAFWEQEVGMGGPWYPVLKTVSEIEYEDKNHMT